MSSLSICVYCGSRPGEVNVHADAARAVGTEIGRRGWRLVYGGGRAGLMGVVADAALAAGAAVVGVIPQSLMARELGHTGLTELHVVETMHQRKMMMAERSDAFLALSGGIGTFEELFEVWSWRQLGYHDKPLGLLNVAGYYDALLAFLRQSRDHGFMSQLQLDLLQVSADPLLMLQRLGELSPLATAPDDYRRI
ncbi:MAG: TIGR00730 family Rossman fold protein [Burkholderiales bacterium]